MIRKLFSIGVTIAFGTAPMFAQNGTTGLPFLKLGVGARPIAMGEAYAALSGDAAAVFYNPASIGSSDPQVLLMHKAWIAGTTTEYLGAIVPGNQFSFGLGVLSNSVDGIEIREQPGPADGTFALHDFALSLSAAVPIDSTLSFGVTGKYLYEKIYVDETSGGALDLGAFWRVDDAVDLAAVLTNLGSMSSMRMEAPVVPSGGRIGGAWHGAIGQSVNATGAVDVLKVFQDNGTRVHVGGELCYDATFSLRAGYQFGYDAKGLSAGVGIAYRLLAFDYAYVPFSNSLGTTQTFAVTFRL